MTDMTLADLRQIMTQCAGEDEGVDLSGDIEDTPFGELGYDSLAVMESASAISRRFGVTIPDDELAELETPRAVLDTVNRALAGANGRRP